MTRIPDHVAHWEKLVTTMAAHSTELAHMEASRAKLAGLLEEFRTLSTQLTGSKQQVSKRLEELFAAGTKLATLLRVGLREHYGNRSEKLVDFAVPPFRGRKRSPEASLRGSRAPPRRRLRCPLPPPPRNDVDVGFRGERARVHAPGFLTASPPQSPWSEG